MFDNQITLKYVVNRYLKKQDTDVFENKVSFNKSIKNLDNIDYKLNMIAKNYEPKTNDKTELNTKPELNMNCLIIILISILLLNYRKNVNVINQIVY